MYFFKKKYIYICINTPVTYDKELFCLTQRCFFSHLDLSPYFGNCIFQCPIMLTVYFSCPSTPKFYIIWPCLKAKLIVILIKSHSVDKNVFFWNFGKIDNLVSIVWTFRCFLCISDVVKVSSRPIHFSNTDCMRIKKKSVVEQLHKEEIPARVQCWRITRLIVVSKIVTIDYLHLTFWKYYDFFFG